MLINKIKSKGFFGSLKAILNRLERLSKYKNLKKNNFTVNFLYEGNAAIRLPSASIWDIFLGNGSIVNRNLDYFTRPNAEVLLRKTVFEMYQNGYLNSKSSIIDIGSWISDNSIVWSKYLSENGIVVAIDPSSENLSYGKLVAKLNNVKNIKWVEAVCAEKAGIKLDFDGSIDHTSFRQAKSDRYLVSSTIDKIVEKENIVIGLLHVDVEGLELSVLKGSENIILRDKPVISFEQHISKEDHKTVSQYLKSFDYRIFMMNEVLSGCELDCRNFLAFPSEKGIPKLKDFSQADGRNIGIFSATIGKALIEI
jgi:FkbM family methyltransferase|tara:strand:+ start:1920 stop:2849 length:930 start_codon:yes stop_codon:yes gene_type:complete